MSARLPVGGRLIDRNFPQRFTFNGRHMLGYSGDTLASALLANDQMLMGRSFKYHRPRGVVGSGAEEPNALLTIGTGPSTEPNQRATQTELFDGLTSRSQNHWPSLEFDIGILNNYAARLLPAGFYYKTFIHPRAAWKHVFEPIIRQSAGLGPAPQQRDGDVYEQAYAFCDVLVVGGGIAGLQAALSAATAGATVILLEQSPHWGGRAPVDGDVIDGNPAIDWINATVTALLAMPNATLRLRTGAVGVYDHGYILAAERLNDHAPSPDQPRQRLWRIRAGRTITAAGAIERGLSFAGNDIPGVMLASALRDYVVNYGVSAGDRTVIVTNNDDAYLTAIALHQAGLSVPAIIDARVDVTGDLPQQAGALGIRILAGRGVAKVKGSRRVTGVEVCLAAGEGTVLETIECDCIAMSGGHSPVVHLYSHCGGKVMWDEAQAMFRPDTARPPTGADGAAMVIAATISRTTCGRPSSRRPRRCRRSCGAASGRPTTC